MRRWYVLLLAAGAAASGCESRPVPVSGAVTLDGKPLAKAVVTFLPPGEDAPIGAAYGVTDDAGRYALTTVLKPRAGVGVGSHKVTISVRKKTPAVMKPATAAKNMDEPRTVMNAEESERETLPSRYNLTTELKFDVPSGGTVAADFDLKSK